MAASPQFRRCISEISTCPLCREGLGEPKSLPCLHTFCLKCLEENCGQKSPGEGSPCPVCLREFVIPVQGLSELPVDFFVESLLDMNDKLAMFGINEFKCQVCSSTSPDQLQFSPPADRQTNLCELCADKMLNGNAAHQIQPSLLPGDAAGHDGMPPKQRRLSGNYCDLHKDELLRLYCFECKKNICAMCARGKHQPHQLQDICQVAEQFTSQIDADTEPMSTRIEYIRKVAARLESEKNKFITEIRQLEQSISERGVAAKQVIDQQVNELLGEVEAVRIATLRDIEHREERFQLALNAMESFNAYWSDLKAMGKPSDITQTGSDLHARAKELLQTFIASSHYSTPDVTFTTADGEELAKNGRNFIGRIHVAQVRQTLPRAEPVYGATTVDSELFVLRYRDEGQVEVYDTTTYKLVRRLTIKGLAGMCDMTSCRHNNCLYVSDHMNQCVHRVDLAADMTQWPVNDKPWGLSVTGDYHVLVTCPHARQLKEFTTHGVLVRLVDLQPDVANPWHSILLPGGQFVVCQWGDTAHRVCIVGTDGHIIQSYGGSRGSAIGQLDVPYHVTVGKDDFLFVADRDNHRVLLLDPTLSYVREVVPRGHGLQYPNRLCLDVHRGLLYVADDKQVTIIGLNQFTAEC